ncbi:unnamed protein product, partial [Effrenium voratum]
SAMTDVMDYDMEVAPVEDEYLAAFQSWLEKSWPLSPASGYVEWLKEKITAASPSLDHIPLWDVSSDVSCSTGWRQVSQSSLLCKVEMYAK